MSPRLVPHQPPSNFPAGFTPGAQPSSGKQAKLTSGGQSMPNSGGQMMPNSGGSAVLPNFAASSNVYFIPGVGFSGHTPASPLAAAYPARPQNGVPSPGGYSPQIGPVLIPGREASPQHGVPFPQGIHAAQQNWAPKVIENSQRRSSGSALSPQGRVAQPTGVGYAPPTPQAASSSGGSQHVQQPGPSLSGARSQVVSAAQQQKSGFPCTAWDFSHGAGWDFLQGDFSSREQQPAGSPRVISAEFL